MKLSWIKSGLLGCVFGVSSWACSVDTNRPLDETEKFMGILLFDEHCTMLGGDTTDFQPRPGNSTNVVPTNYSLMYACPNPAIGKTTTIYWQIPQADSVWILAYNQPGSAAVDTLSDGFSPAGMFSMLWRYDGPAGIYRIKMFTKDGFSSYGDVQLQD